MVTRVGVCASLLLYLLNGILVDGTANNSNGSGVIAAKNFYLGGEVANFFQAYIACKDIEMDLVSVNSRQDEEDLDYFLKGQIEGYWLSGTNLPDVNSTQYYWLTGGKKAIYTDWFPGEPNNEGGNENCIQWIVRNQVSGWNDLDCNAKLKYICQDNQSQDKTN